MRITVNFDGGLMPTLHTQFTNSVNSAEKRIGDFYSNHMGLATLDIALVAVGTVFGLLAGATPIVGLVLPGVMLVSLVAVRMLETIKLWWGARQDRLFNTQLPHLAPELRGLITDQLNRKNWTVSQARRFLQLVNQSTNQSYNDLAQYFVLQEGASAASAPHELPFYVFGGTATMALTLTMLKGSAVIIAGASIPLALIVAPLVAILGMYLLARAGAAVYQAYQARQFSKMAALTIQENDSANPVPSVGEKDNKVDLLSKNGPSSQGLFLQPVPPAYPENNDSIVLLTARNAVS